MPKVGEIYTSKYLKNEDLKGKSWELTIKQATVEDSFGKPKPVLYFVETDKCLTVQVGNARILTQLLEDDEITHWVGAKVTLTPVFRNIGGEVKKLIDITNARWDRGEQQAAAASFAPALQAQAAPAFAQAPQVSAPVMAGNVPQGGQLVADDDIPF
jgi:hypothetical protein